MRLAHRAPTLLLVALLAKSGDASAQDEAPIGPHPRRWAVGFNPLAIAIGRYGGDVQRLLGPHHALLLNLHGDFASHDWPAIEYDRVSPVWGFGGEVGWRWFTQNAGMVGLFVGASLIGGWYSVDYRGRRLGLPGVGVSADIGRQWELGGNLFLAFGLGLQHLWTARYPADIAPGVSQVMGAGFDPRVILTFGAKLR